VFRLPVTVAINCVDPNVETELEPPVIDTFVAGPAWTVTVAVPDFVVSVPEIALIVKLAGLGTVVGATYTPPFEINPCVESPLLGVASTISQNTL